MASIGTMSRVSHSLHFFARRVGISALLSSSGAWSTIAALPFVSTTLARFGSCLDSAFEDDRK